MTDSVLIEMNLRSNRKYARDWMQEISNQMFNISENGHRHSLKAFMNPEGKVLWLEFKTTGRLPCFSCPLSLADDPVAFRADVESAWINMIKIAKRLGSHILDA